MTINPVAAGGGVIDETELWEHFEGDRELIREVAGLFREDSPKRLAALRSAIAEGDAAALSLAAHSIRGSANNFGATDAVAVASELETLARAGDLSRAPALCEKLVQEIGRLMDALEDMEAPAPGQGQL